jgi:hypothetical protein
VRSRAEVRNGISSLLIALVFSGYGLFRHSERPVFGTVLMIVGLVNMLVSGVSFGLAIWGDR